MTGDSTAVLAPGVARERERHLIEAVVLGMVVVSDFDAVIRMDALGMGKAQVILAESILVPDKPEPLLGLPQKLPSQAEVTVVLGVGLPAIDDPWLDFQFVGGKPLNTHAVEEPRCVRRHIRRLIDPIIEIVVTE